MAGRPKGLPKSGGRQRGTPNKTTALLKDAILLAAERAGGEAGLVGYLQTQATASPGPFMALLGKVLPTQLTGDTENPVEMNVSLDSKAQVKALAALIKETSSES
jgi:hypothetical protein